MATNERNFRVKKGLVVGDGITVDGGTVDLSSASSIVGVLTDITGESIDSLSNVDLSTAASQGQVLAYNSSTSNWEPTNVSSLSAAEVNDLSQSVTWVNVPDANITQSSVTQHEAALSITESQISDLGTYLTDITAQSIEDLSDVHAMTKVDGYILSWDATNSRWDAVANSGGTVSTIVNSSNSNAAINSTTDALAIGSDAEVANFKSVAVGDLAKQRGVLGVSIGYNAQGGTSGTTNSGTIAIGGDVEVSGGYGVAIGANTRAGFETIAIGSGATATTGTTGSGANALFSGSIAIGLSSQARRSSSLAIGHLAEAGAGGANQSQMALGHAAEAEGARAIAIGYDTEVPTGHQNSIAIGPGATTTASQQLMIGGTNTTTSSGRDVIEDIRVGYASYAPTNAKSLVTKDYVDAEVAGVTFTETNDLTAAVTWANIPDANVPQSAVTQHQASLSLTHGQVTDFDTEVDARIALANVEDLADTTITAAASGDFLRHNGTAWVDSTIQDADIAQSAVTQHEAALSITESQISDLGTYQATSEKGQANGYAELDGSGKVPSAQLPSYVDDVEEYAGSGSFPGTGEAGKIYVDTSQGDIYRWSGSNYVQINDAVTSSDQATQLATARTISLSGDVTGSVSFNGTADVDIVATVADGSHNHTAADVTDFSTAADARIAAASIGDVTDVDITTAAPTSGQLLGWDGSSKFVPVNPGLTRTTLNTTSTAQTTLWEKAPGDFDGGEFTIFAKEGTNVEMCKALIIHDGTDISFTEYGETLTNTNVATFTAELASATAYFAETAISNFSTSAIVNTLDWSLSDGQGGTFADTWFGVNSAGFTVTLNWSNATSTNFQTTAANSSLTAGNAHTSWQSFMNTMLANGPVFNTTLPNGTLTYKYLSGGGVSKSGFEYVVGADGVTLSSATLSDADGNTGAPTWAPISAAVSTTTAQGSSTFSQQGNAKILVTPASANSTDFTIEERLY